MRRPVHAQPLAHLVKLAPELIALAPNHYKGGGQYPDNRNFKVAHCDQSIPPRIEALKLNTCSALCAKGGVA